MSEEELKPHLNPYTLLTDPVDVFDTVAVPVPPGTKAPPRPPGRERAPGLELPVTEPFEIFECQAIPVPPGTKAPPRPPDKERVVLSQPAAGPASTQIDALVTRIESALQSIQDALAQIKHLHGKAG